MLEIARNFGNGPLKRKDIALSQDLSNAYLENILISLKTKGLIKTVRGASGGFSLAREPATITVLDIVVALEGSIAPVDCIEQSKACPKSKSCVTRRVWNKMYDAQVAVLGGISLADLLDWEKQGDAVMTYAI